MDPPDIAQAVCTHLNCVDTTALACCSKSMQAAVGWLAIKKTRDLRQCLADAVAAFKRGVAATPGLQTYGDYDWKVCKRFWVAHGASKESDEWTHTPEPVFPHQAYLGEHVHVDSILRNRIQPDMYIDLENQYEGTATLWTYMFRVEVVDDGGYYACYARTDEDDVFIKTTTAELEHSDSDDEQPPWPPRTPEEEEALARGRGDEWVRLVREDNTRRQRSCLKTEIHPPTRYTRFVEHELDRLFP